MLSRSHSYVWLAVLLMLAGPAIAQEPDEVTLDEGLEALIESLKGENEGDVDEFGLRSQDGGDGMGESIEIEAFCKKTVVVKFNVYAKKTSESGLRWMLFGHSRKKEQGESTEVTMTLVNSKCPG